MIVGTLMLTAGLALAMLSWSIGRELLVSKAKIVDTRLMQAWISLFTVKQFAKHAWKALLSIGILLYSISLLFAHFCN